MINIIIEVHGGRYRDKPISSEILKKITAALKGADYEKEFRVVEGSPDVFDIDGRAPTFFYVRAPSKHLRDLAQRLNPVGYVVLECNGSN